MNKKLTDSEVKIIKKMANEKIGLCRKNNDIIGTQIFYILSQYARVIYYPIGKDAPWGFTRIKGNVDDGNSSKPFVAINTSIPVDCQVFAAAHELYHIWYENKPDFIPSDLSFGTNEAKANRFAAEFLVDELLLKQEIDMYEFKDFTIKEVLLLASLFSVPYQTIVKRLWEIGYIKEKNADELLTIDCDEVNMKRKLYSIPIPKVEERTTIDNLVELSVNAYEKKLITYEKLEYLLEICSLKPSDLCINKDSEYSSPSDAELDSIMEE